MIQQELEQAGQILAKILNENVGNRITTATGHGILGQFIGEMQPLVTQAQEPAIVEPSKE